MKRFLKLFLFCVISFSILLNVYFLSKDEKKINIFSIQHQINRIEDDLFQMERRLIIPSKFVDKLLIPMAKKESQFNSLALGDFGRSIGLFQIQLPTALEVLMKGGLSKEDLYNPYVNSFIAVEFLRNLKKKHLGIKEVLAAYNGGLKRVNGKDTIINYNSYVKPILLGANL